MSACIKRKYLISLLPLSKENTHDLYLFFCAVRDNTVLATTDVLAFYRIHKHNTAGIGKYKKRELLEIELEHLTNMVMMVLLFSISGTMMLSSDLRKKT